MGKSTRRAPQKYQNKRAWTIPKHDKKKRAIAELPVVGFCTRCYQKIMWRKRFGKYKPLKHPAKCEECLKRKVKHAYHRLCKDCKAARNCCARCKSDKNEIVTEELTEAEMAAMEAKALKLINSLPLRQKNSVLRLFEMGEVSLEDITRVAEGRRLDDDEDDEDDGEDAGEDDGEDAGEDAGEDDGEDAEPSAAPPTSTDLAAAATGE